MKTKLTAAALALSLLLLTACGENRTETAPGQTRIAGLDGTPAETVSEDTKADDNALTGLGLSAEMSAGTLPEIAHGSDEYDPATALGLLGLCAGHTAEATARLFEAAGFTVLLQQNFDKAADDPGHTCAFSVGVRQTAQGQTEYLIAVRGTNGGEWYSNFDFAPSQREDTAFAENFLFTAEDAFAAVTGLIDFTGQPRILVCGHSRGAACANLLGVLLDGVYLPQQIYVYTFATPMTVRPGYFDGEYDNIFNILNPGDVVPRLPLAGWGFARAGTDIVLKGDADAEDRAQRVADTLLGIAPDILSYYTVRHSLTAAGESGDGVTAFSLMELLCAAFAGVTDLTDTENREAAAQVGTADFSGLIADESDFAPLRDLLVKAAEDGGNAAAEVLNEHLPATYAGLLETR